MSAFFVKRDGQANGPGWCAGRGRLGEATRHRQVAAIVRARLQVVRTSAGFEDACVAAPSQTAALKAWGARGDLVALGEAEVVTDEALTAEPLARLGEVARRPRGDMAAMLAATPKVAKPATGAGEATSGRSAVPASPPPLAVRRALDAAERALGEAHERLAHELDAIAQERTHLDEQEARTRGRSKRSRIHKKSLTVRLPVYT